MFEVCTEKSLLKRVDIKEVNRDNIGEDWDRYAGLSDIL
jgi:hypothetical protein